MEQSATTTGGRGYGRAVERSRILARLLRAILSTPEAAEFQTQADVVDALKARCARLRIGWTNEAISAALRLLASNTPLPGSLPQRQPSRFGREEQPVGRAEAAKILRRLGVRV